MSNGEHTPPAGTVAPWALETVCAGRHERSNRTAISAETIASQAHRRLDGLTGIDGGKGRVGTLEMNQDRVAEILERVQRNQERSGAKLAIVWAASTAAAALGAAAILRIVFGGV